MREEMPDRRAGRACRLVEVDDAFFGGDDERKRRDGFRHRGEPDGTRRVSVQACRAARIHHAGRRELDRPLVNLAKRLHSRRY